jgi:hypothetical protein
VKTNNSDQIESAFKILHAVTEAIRELRRVPSGQLYSQLCGVLTLQQYERIIETLKRTGLVTETGAHELVWTGPTITEECEQNSLLH